ncbi:TetR/AcrR family transcriptional regulator [Mycobacterium sp. CBMA293]|uniref:TetR/AcrR family transcriptional regulator n=1 Tax=unclassified Mycolicibacterium TaxID=2636767 RepID=UPI0012DE7AA8|nr:MULTISPECIES: TetR/AcrR family transcriptional regulator [unclassified Mycolicibacterium]MUL44876.1 TetR/AcrR family transcriptional regulator [Mycolicibacterium sp. CBMA 360]MUL58015.1 TetR/AcrR family transcriptional regulator [Mycolicibacterium sp. CBMA 335]MUL73473.1 TetR/AcrR family transcriptional regulator [Mycolicibacterium sp. CBMA 311]MUL95469.1 TetR/AcrR family transcriptional regulator [Mycolicibacterium sp. CBMA 230]MUM07446.1 TetR family transcriptional regulator [Mycolicibact
MAIGRPREFDPERVLDTAMRLFWAHGYDGVSISDLTDATGVNRRSLYSEYGSKADLFRATVRRYQAGPGGYAERALALPTAWDTAYATVHGAVDASSGTTGPRGCLLVQSALAAGDEATELRAELAQFREDGVAELAERFRVAQLMGELPGADPHLLARWIGAVCQGLAVQANGGADRDELHAVADQALRAWPGTPQAAGVPGASS